MSRHNRRRSRGGRKHASPSRAGVVSPDSMSLAEDQSLFRSTTDSSRESSPSPDFVDRIPIMPANMPLPRSSAPSARVWHNRYAAWQARIQLQEQTAMASKTAERRRIFGSCKTYPAPSLAGEDELSLSDDDNEDLEEKMMDYFQGLEWLV